MLQKLNELKAQYISEYLMPLNHPANVEVLDDDSANNEKRAKLRSNSDFINARLLEAGLPLGGGLPEITPTSSSKLTLSQHSEAISRFVHDLEGTGCYDAIQVYLGHNTNTPEHIDSIFDVTVKLKEKNWYKLYIGGGVNSEDLSSLGNGGANAFGGELTGGLPKLQFETSASLLNVTGFADVSTASYSVDQTGASSFKFMHDRPLCSWFPRHSGLYEWLMPRDPSTVDPQEREGANDNDINEQQVFVSDDAQYSLGGGSHSSIGIHTLIDEQDYESTRSYKEFTRSIGIRLANHARGAARGPGLGGANKPSVTSPEAMSGPYVYLDWSVKLRDTLPRRHREFPFALDCSREVASQSGTTLKHSLIGGVYLNGCFNDDRYDPTMGYDTHIMGEISGPPGDVGFCKMKGGASWHFPLELLRMIAFGGSENETTSEEEPVVIGATIHSSFNAGAICPLTFNGLCNNRSFGQIPLSDRFYVGGPGQLRGFLPAGIGPRAVKVRAMSTYAPAQMSDVINKKYTCYSSGRSKCTRWRFAWRGLILHFYICIIFPISQVLFYLTAKWCQDVRLRQYWNLCFD